MVAEHQRHHNDMSSVAYRERIRHFYPEFTERHLDALVAAFERDKQKELDKPAKRPHLFVVK